MDIEKHIKFITNFPNEIWRNFYRSKKSSVLNNSYMPRMRVGGCDLINTIKQAFPEASIKEIGENTTLIKLKNADFTIGTFGMQKYIYTKNVAPVIWIEEIHNLIEFMKEIDRQMPNWEADFADYMSQHEKEIETILQKSLSNGYSNTSDILKCRIQLMLLECRENTDTGVILQKTLENKQVSFRNIVIKPEKDLVFISIPEIQNCSESFRNKEINVVLLQKIDALVPQWIEEQMWWGLELEKQKKVIELSQLSIKTLIRQKMKVLGYEYKIKKNEKSISLFIKLEKSRMLKLSLPDLAINTISRRIDMIEDAVKAINNIHDYFRITNEDKSIEWENGNDTK